MFKSTLIATAGLLMTTQGIQIDTSSDLDLAKRGRKSHHPSHYRTGSHGRSHSHRSGSGYGGSRGKKAKKGKKGKKAKKAKRSKRSKSSHGSRSSSHGKHIGHGYRALVSAYKPVPYQTHEVDHTHTHADGTTHTHEADHTHDGHTHTH